MLTVADRKLTPVTIVSVAGSIVSAALFKVSTNFSLVSADCFDRKFVSISKVDPSSRAIPSWHWTACDFACSSSWGWGQVES